MIGPRLLLAAAMAFVLAAGAPAQKLSWAKGFDQAQSQAAKANKLIMVDFWTTWCGYCKQMDATTMKDKRVIEKSRLVVPVKVNAEAEGRALARKYGINSFPTFLFIDAKGNEYGRLQGAMPADQFTSAISNLAGYHRDLLAATARIKRNPKDGEAYAILAFINAARKNAGEGDAQAAKAISLGYKGPKLAEAYVTLGDYQRINRKLAMALAYYQKSLRFPGTPRDKAYAHYAVSALSADIGKMDDAKKHASLAVKVKGAPKDLIEAAKRLQAQLNQG